MKKTVLVTGAGSGIGLAATELFLEKGYFVFAHYHNNNEALLKINSTNLKLFKADFGSIDEITKLASDCNSYGGVDILINNAADYSAKLSIDNVIGADVEKVYRVNAVAPFLLTQTLIGRMIDNKWGRIINVSSIGVKYGGSINSVAYAMSKAALETMTISFCKYAAKHNVLVNCIRAGVTDTDFHSKASNKNIEQRIAMIPMGRMANVTEVAKSIFFLASDDSSFCNGSILTVAGGE